MKIERLNIIDTLRNANYHSSVILSYSFDIMFYEQVIWKSFKQAGCLNNLVLVDKQVYDEVFEQCRNDRVSAGRAYSLLPVSANSCFHPKVVFLAGHDNITILIGSGNATPGGYSLNREMFVVLPFENEDEKARPFIRSVWNFIRNVTPLPSHSYALSQMQVLESELPWLLDGPDKSVDYSDGFTTIQFFKHSPEESIYQQFVKKLKQVNVHELTVISPFFDEKCNGLKTIQKDLSPDRMNVVVQSAKVNLNHAALPKSKSIALYEADTEYKDAYLHAKIYLAVGKKSAHLLIGSANCTNNGLGLLKGRSENIEACLYIQSDKADYFDEAIGLPRILQNKNLLKMADLKKIKYRKNPRVGERNQIQLQSLELRNGKCFAQLSSWNNKSSYTLFLISTHTEDILQYGLHSIQHASLVFDVHDNWLPSVNAGFIEDDKRNRTNTIFLSHQLELQKNAPSPRSAIVAQIIQYLNEENGDFVDLVEHLEYFLFNEREVRNSYKSISPKPQTDSSPTSSSQDDHRISYEDFLAKAKPIQSSELSIHGACTDLGLVMSFLLGIFGLSKKMNHEPITEEPDINDNIYLEEFPEAVPQIIQPTLSKLTQSTATSDEERRYARYYRSKVTKLANRYVSYLDFLIKGDPDSRIPPPIKVHSNELSKFYICAAVINMYAGKMVGEDQEEVFPLDDEQRDSYRSLMTAIIWKCFCHFDQKRNHLPVIKKIQIEGDLDAIPTDILASILMAAYCMCVMLEFCECDKDQATDLKIAAYKLYLNLKLYSKMFEDNVVEEYFHKFYERSGFKDYRNPLTNAQYLTFEGVLNRHHNLKQRTGKINTQLKGAADRYKCEVGKLPRVRSGFYVWTPRTELGYIESLDGNSVVLYDWEDSAEYRIRYPQGYVLKVDIE